MRRTPRACMRMCMHVHMHMCMCMHMLHMHIVHVHMHACAQRQHIHTCTASACMRACMHVHVACSMHGVDTCRHYQGTRLACALRGSGKLRPLTQRRTVCDFCLTPACQVRSMAEAQWVLSTLLQDRRIARASHNMLAYRFWDEACMCMCTCTCMCMCSILPHLLPDPLTVSLSEHRTVMQYRDHTISASITPPTHHPTIPPSHHPTIPPPYHRTAARAYSGLAAFGARRAACSRRTTTTTESPPPGRSW